MTELWTVAQAAAHWGVSLGRARQILSRRHIKRISGYPAEEIKAVERHQGKRTDLTENHQKKLPGGRHDHHRLPD